MTSQPAPFDLLPFELTLLLPADLQFASAVCVLAGQAARHVGCDDATAEQFGADVVAALRQCIGDFPEGGAPPVQLVLRRAPKEIEAILTCGNRVRIGRPIPADA